MSRNLAAQKRTLLSLVGTERAGPEVPELAVMSRQDWSAIDAMAAQHRIQPWLHHRMRGSDTDWPVPPSIASVWRDAYRDGAIGALTAQAALVRLAKAFDDAGIPMVVLKGGYLAFFAYPEAALRPMRDLDILVAAGNLPLALEAMAQAGCTVPDDRGAAIARALDGDKHLDPIALPTCDRFIELHHRITLPDTFDLPTHEILREKRSIDLGGVQVGFPSAGHMLGHLILHAAYNHRFDCGPLALIDIAMLTRSAAIDGNGFRAMAAEGGWLPGAQLVLALVEKHLGHTGMEIGQHGVPASVLAGGENLILQDFDQRAQVKLASESARNGLAATLLSRLRHGISVRHDEGLLHWAAGRAMRTMRQGGNTRARSEAAAGAAIARWLYRS